MKLKRIFAAIVVVLLIALYVSTLVFALSDSPDAPYLFKASIFCTVIIPLLLYGVSILEKYVIRKSDRKNAPDDDKKNRRS